MAGAGYKLFNTGDILTAQEVNEYLMQQTVMVFANSTARTTALSSVLAEGMLSYLKDTNATEVYDGSAWVSVSGTGDITGVTAGTGISGGGVSGTVTVTNSMATAIDAKGDLIAGTGADTFDRLAVGANDTVLTADSSTATGLKWATPSSGGATLLSTTTLSGSSVTVSGITTGYKSLFVTIENPTFSTASRIRITNASDTGCQYAGVSSVGATPTAVGSDGSYLETKETIVSTAGSDFILCLTIEGYDAAVNTRRYALQFWGTHLAAGSNENSFHYGGSFGASTGPWTSIVFKTSTGTFSGGSIKIYGVK